MRRFIRTTLRPEVYHGHGKQPPFFEGWYIKLVSADEQRRYAIIPGIFLSHDISRQHAFIQVLDGISGKATYHVFPDTAFSASDRQFAVRLGDNVFSKHSVQLNIADEQLNLHGQISFEGTTPWAVRWHSPGAMGWYSWMPMMECYHGVVSLHHRLRGSLTVNGETIDFTGGIGYIEKDWGQSFPSGYIWTQTNHFDTPQTCLVASAAMIPFIGRTFPGFLIGFLYKGTLYRFATYTGAKIERLAITDDHVYYAVSDRRHRLTMVAERAEGGLLLGPSREEMHRRVNETLKARVEVTLAMLDGRTLFHETGRNAGLEVHGNTEALLTG